MCVSSLPGKLVQMEISELFQDIIIEWVFAVYQALDVIVMTSEPMNLLNYVALINTDHLPDTLREVTFQLGRQI